MKSYDFRPELDGKPDSNNVILEFNGTAGKSQVDEVGANDEPFLKGVSGFFRANKQRIKKGRNLLFLAAYLAYYGYAMYCHFGDEPSIRLTVFTIFGLVCIIWRTLNNQGSFLRAWKGLRRQLYNVYSTGRRPKILRWALYVLWACLFIVYVVVNVAMKDAKNLIPLGGFAVYILILVLMSNNRRRINWHCVFYGTILQCLIGLFILKTEAGTTVLMWFSDRLVEFIGHSDAGSSFVFGRAFINHEFAMKVIPSIVVFVAVINVLIYLGAINFIVTLAGAPMAYILDVSAPEAMNAFANIFLGGAESGATMYQYLLTMPLSRLFAICVGGLASCAGSNLIQYMAFGVPMKYLLAASAMSAPAALACAKIVFPDTEEYDITKTGQEVALDTTHGGSVYTVSTIDEEHRENHHLDANDTSCPSDIKINNADDKGEVKVIGRNEEVQSSYQQPKSIGEALVTGTTHGINLVVSIVGLLIVSLAVIQLLNQTVQWFGERVNVDISLNLILSYLFYPFVYVMGVDSEDCLRAGEYMGIRTLSSPAVSYIYLGRVIANKQALEKYTSMFNETLTYERSDDIFLPKWNRTLVGGVFSDRSEIIVTYALCGFASLPTIGITFGLVTAFIPKRLPEISRLGLQLLVAGTLASYLTACVAGLLS